jgi:hypothetical protein
MIFIFFLSADKKMSKEIIKKNSLHIILFLLLIYFIYNNLHLGFLLFIILGVILYYTNFKTYILNNLQQHSIKNYFPNQLIDLISPHKNTSDTYINSDINSDINSEINSDSNIQESIRKIEKKYISKDDRSEDDRMKDDRSEDDRLNELMDQIHEELSN